MQHLAALAEDFDQRYDLRSGRVDQVRMVVDSIRHDRTPLVALFVRPDAYDGHRSLWRNAE